MNAKHFLLLAALGGLTLTGTVQAQWQWRDETGRKVFSDRPPPPGVQEKNMLSRPAALPPASKTSPPETAASDSATPPASRSGKPTGTDPELDQKKAAQDAEQERQKLAQEQNQMQQRQENCERARRAISTLQSGQLMSSTNTKGERGFMSDDVRQQELTHARQVMDNDCRP